MLIRDSLCKIDVMLNVKHIRKEELFIIVENLALLSLVETC